MKLSKLEKWWVNQFKRAIDNRMIVLGYEGTPQENALNSLLKKGVIVKVKDYSAGGIWDLKMVK